jgi:hypothetical protein
VTILALRVLLAPASIVAATLVARRFGSRDGGVVGGLPVIAGPILLVLAFDHGASFAATASTGMLLGIAALIAFVLVYAAVCRRRTWPWAIVAGWLAFAGSVAALRPVHVDAVAALALALACAACAVTLVVVPAPPPAAVAPVSYPRWDLPFRAACAAVPVVAVTGLASLLGPHLSGLVAATPIITPVLAAFTHAQQGPRETARILHGFTLGFFAYAFFCFVVTVGVEPLGIGPAFALATVVALATHAAAVAFTRRSDQPLPVEAAAQACCSSRARATLRRHEPRVWLPWALATAVIAAAPLALADRAAWALVLDPELLAVAAVAGIVLFRSRLADLRPRG